MIGGERWSEREGREKAVTRTHMETGVICQFAILSECTVLLLPLLVQSVTLLVQVALKHATNTSVFGSSCQTSPHEHG